MNNYESSSSTSRPFAGLPKRALRSTTKAALAAASSTTNNSSPALDIRMTSLSLSQRLQHRGSSPHAHPPTTPSNGRKRLTRSASLKKTASYTKVADPCTPRPKKRVRFSGTPPPAPSRHPLGKPPMAPSTLLPRMKMPGGLKASNEKKRKRNEDDDE